MPEIKTINLPDFGDFDEVEVIEICVKEDQKVDSEEPILVLETDKAAMEIPSSVDGTVRKVLLKTGDKVAIGMPFLEIEPADVVDEPIIKKQSIEQNNDDQSQFFKLVKDITSKGFVRNNYKKKLVDLSDIKLNLKGKKK